MGVAEGLGAKPVPNPIVVDSIVQEAHSPPADRDEVLAVGP